jgi:hypothetical protein
VVSGKIRFNGKFLDPSVLKKKDWELNAEEKYEKGIFEHVKSKVHSERSKNANSKQFWEENKMDGFEGYGDFDEKDHQPVEAKGKEGAYSQRDS